MQSDFRVLADALLSMIAPTVMALSAKLNAGKYQRFCQCTRMKSITWPRAMRSYRLPSAPPNTRANAIASQVSSRPRRLSHTTSTALTTTAIRANSQRCQPPPSARKLKAAPVL